MSYYSESKEHYKKQLTERLVNEVVLYKKYRDDANESMNQLFNSCSDTIVLNKKEKLEVIENAKEILKNVYKINVITDEPLKFKTVDI